MRLLGISGSLRRASHNTALLNAAAAMAPEGVEFQLYEGLDRLPPYNEDHDVEEAHPEVTRLREEIRAADAVLISTPEYNGSVPGQVKQVVDWASRPFGTTSALWGKPVGVIGASVTDYGAIWAQDHLRKSLGLAGARVIDVELAIGKAHDQFGADGELLDDALRERLADVVNAIIDQTTELAPGVR